MKRRMFNFAAGVSLVLCVATVALWVRSYRAGDSSPKVVVHGREYDAFTSLGGILITSSPVVADIDIRTTRFFVTYWERPQISWTTGILNGDPFWRLRVEFPVMLFVCGLPLLMWLCKRVFESMRSCGGRGPACAVCGYDIRATTDRCPECGAAVAEK